jgi:hypothetical protein
MCGNGRRYRLSRNQIVSVSGSRGAFESGYFDNLQTRNKHADAIGAAIDEFFLPAMGIQLSKGENFHSGIALVASILLFLTYLMT